MEGQCFPKTVDDLKPVLEIAAEFGVNHIDLQPNVRPRRLQDCIPLLEGWRRLADEAKVDVYIETHRDRMTTDLHFTLDLLDCFPDLKLLGDISHFVVGREFPGRFRRNTTSKSAESSITVGRSMGLCRKFFIRLKAA